MTGRARSPDEVGGMFQEMSVSEQTEVQAYVDAFKQIQDAMGMCARTAVVVTCCYCHCG